MMKKTLSLLGVALGITAFGFCSEEDLNFDLPEPRPTQIDLSRSVDKKIKLDYLIVKTCMDGFILRAVNNHCPWVSNLDIPEETKAKIYPAIVELVNEDCALVIQDFSSWVLGFFDKPSTGFRTECVFEFISRLQKTLGFINRKIQVKYSSPSNGTLSRINEKIK